MLTANKKRLSRGIEYEIRRLDLERFCGWFFTQEGLHLRGPVNSASVPFQPALDHLIRVNAEHVCSAEGVTTLIDDMGGGRD